MYIVLTLDMSVINETFIESSIVIVLILPMNKKLNTLI